ncbi:metal ABC transporter substrate-binding protein [Rothia sp. P6271]|uniref:metal ABC transporter substrate-binding protein n=1 Tax=unclassified Rothia (in: high G+C Gram-positive bacteria) TaxID=2689056 RepID=UPI003AD56AC7
MKKSPKFLALCTSAVLLLSACGGAGSPSAKSNAEASASTGKPHVLTTFTVLQDIAQNVAGDHLDVQSITKPGAEIHHYEPTPGDIEKATHADLILDNGLNLETWFKKFVQNTHAPHVKVSEGVTPISITEDAYAGKPNPHAWMSPLVVKKYVDNIADAFVKLDPAHESDYRANAKAYQEKLQKVHDDLVSSISTIPKEQRALVTCEGAFSYLTKDAGLQEKYIWAVNSDAQATPSQIESVVKFVKDKKVPAVFCESTVSDHPMQQVVTETGTPFGGTLYVDSLSEKGGPVPTYLDLITYDAKTISKALTQEK